MSNLLDDKKYCERAASALGIRIECDAYEGDTIWVVSSDGIDSEDVLGEASSEAEVWAEARETLAKRAEAAIRIGLRCARLALGVTSHPAGESRDSGEVLALRAILSSAINCWREEALAGDGIDERHAAVYAAACAAAIGDVRGQSIATEGVASDRPSRRSMGR